VDAKYPDGLIGRDGVLLLAADYVLDESLIQQVLDFENSAAERLTLHVRA